MIGVTTPLWKRPSIKEEVQGSTPAKEELTLIGVDTRRGEAGEAKSVEGATSTGQARRGPVAHLALGTGARVVQCGEMPPAGAD